MAITLNTLKSLLKSDEAVAGSQLVIVHSKGIRQKRYGLGVVADIARIRFLSPIERLLYNHWYCQVDGGAEASSSENKESKSSNALEMLHWSATLLHRSISSRLISGPAHLNPVIQDEAIEAVDLLSYTILTSLSMLAKVLYRRTPCPPSHLNRQ